MLAAIYASLQTLLDEAIADLADGACPDPCPTEAEFNFGGDPAAWTAVAHSLKARLHMHWGEVEGAARYQEALAEAQLGIASTAGDWTQQHSGAITEANPWFLFEQSRQNDITASATLVGLMNGGTPDDPSDDDPRLALYFDPAADGVIRGSPPGTPSGDPATNTSLLNLPGTAAYPQPILNCTETQMIAAEASFRLGDEAGAKTFAGAALGCEEQWWASQGRTIDLSAQRAAIDAASGDALLDAIMTQKFVSLFLVPEVYNDWKRTCLPARAPAFGAQAIPGRFLYSSGERQTNSNMPTPDQQLTRNGGRNANDPAGC